MRPPHLLVPLALLLAVSCKVGPNYQRPSAPVPAQYRDDTAPQPSGLGEMKWYDLFRGETLQALIRECLAKNYDARIAAARIIQAQGQFQGTRSALFPSMDGTGVGSRVGTSYPLQSTGQLFVSAAWEVDIWGKLRRATEAARADLLATEENRKAVIQSIVAQVAVSYFQLLEYDLELVLVRESIKARTGSARLVQARLEGGVASRLDFDQAQSLVFTAEANAAQLEKAITQTENLICYLLARDPGPIDRGKPLPEFQIPPGVPAGLPSTLLDRRPDIALAEQRLVAANARVGVAKAAFFPSISLTGALGFESSALSLAALNLGVAENSGKGYAIGGVLDVPIFDAGRRAGNYKSAKAQREELIVTYQQAVNEGFREVSDALIGYQKSKEFRIAQEALTKVLRDQSELATERYTGSVSSYLEVLDTERQRLTAEQTLAQAQRDELISIVNLYKALAGGWQQS